jgi:putative serine protease PepD
MSEQQPPYPPPAPPQRALPPPVAIRRGPGLLGTVLVAAVVAAVVGAFAGLGGYVVGRDVDAAEQQTTSAGTRTVQDSVTERTPPVAGSIADIAASTLPAVVSILAEGTTDSGSGSGFAIRPNGYLLTNNHVVDLVADGGTLTVVFSDGERIEGKVVGTNSSYDLAVVKVDKKGLATVDLGDSSGARVGDVAIAIGAPLGLDGTVTSGIISALDRPVTAGGDADLAYINAIQTDAAINPGNSGGPLLDASGSVIGVNSAIATLAVGAESGNIGLGFAIPINSAQRIADEIIATGSSRTPRIDVQLDLRHADPGARLDEVTKGGAADTAGLEAGDVIVRIDDRSIDDATELVVAIRSYAPGDSIEVGYERDGEGRTATLTLGDDSASD